jgi:phage terminase large subunit
MGRAPGPTITFEPAARPSRLSRAAQRSSYVFDFREKFLHELMLSTRVRFPSPKYRDDPLAFFREILGVEPWSRQIDIIDAVRTYPRVAVCSGHKVSKSHTAAGLALWYFCSYEDARVVMTSTTSRQVDQILWRELRMMRARAGRCVTCKRDDPDGLVIARPCAHSALIEGEQGDLARTGLKTPDFREIFGFTAREPEAVAGISGRHVLYVVDEASGVADEIFEAMEGNAAGGARSVYFSNGTRNEGAFFEAFYAKAEFYKTLRISSEETPNVIAGEVVIPGLATRDWIEEKKREWGEDSALYKVRVKGEHALAEEGRIFTIHMIGEAEARWSTTPDAGRLYIGVDPAGETAAGDETVFVARRGLKMIGMWSHRNKSEAAIVTLLAQLIDSIKLPRETPVVVVDVEGAVGATVLGALREHVRAERARTQVDPFELVTIKASGAPMRQPNTFGRLRDELCQNLYLWFRDGGAIIEDTKLAQELHTLEWFEDTKGKSKVTPKDDIRKALGGRSPDHYDALALSAWEPQSLRAEAEPKAPPPPAALEHAERVIDPYGAMDAWRNE